MPRARAQLIQLWLNLPGLEDEPGRKALIALAGFPDVGLYLPWSGAQEAFSEALANQLVRRGQRFTIDFLRNMAGSAYVGEPHREALVAAQRTLEAIPADDWAREFAISSPAKQDDPPATADLDMLTAAVVSTLLLPYYELGAAGLTRAAGEQSAQLAGQIARRVDASFATETAAGAILASFQEDPRQYEASMLAALRLLLNQDNALARDLASLLRMQEVQEVEGLQSMVEVSQRIRTVKGDVVGVLLGKNVLERLAVYQAADLVEERGTVAGAAINSGVDGESAFPAVGRMEVTQQAGTVEGDLVAGNKIIIINPPPIAPGKPKLQVKLSTLQISAGRFLMGSEPGKGISPHETPPFTVELPAFKIGRSPVTNSEYERYLRHTGKTAPRDLGWDKVTSPSPAQNERPVRGVTLQEALAYCAWLSEYAEQTCTLPSEVQWECAAQQAGRELGMIDGIREWTTSVWGEQRRTPDPAARYPWQPDPYSWEPGDSHDDLTLNDQIRRVTRGGSARLTSRGSELRHKRGLVGSGIGFRIVINSEE